MYDVLRRFIHKNYNENGAKAYGTSIKLIKKMYDEGSISREQNDLLIDTNNHLFDAVTEERW